MAEIALRNYNQEVQDLIDHGHLDEAIAHCQHILARYPKHVETYRVLGKAFLEQGRHADAADIFQRVLSAIPDDFLSHVAMAIMREDSGNLDAAIWHMERAHEVNPSNPTVQQEVRRLRGRRDGVEPARLRLTRAALARMYIKGGFYAQAVAEIRAALEEDADRPDLQVMLATALAQSGQAAEAGEICNSVLAKLPYCIEANQIQAQILWRVGRKPEAQEVFRRLSLLDPYRGVRPPTEDGRIPEVPAGAVTLSRLTWEPGIPSSSAPPGWKEGLGLTAPDSGDEESKIPAWLEGATPGPHQSPFVQDAEGPELQPPDWLSEGAAGLAVSPDGAEALLGSDEPELSLASSAEEIPDWLRQAPPEKKGEVAPGSFPDWLKPEGAVDAQAKGPADAPEWLKAAEQDAGLSVPGEGLPGWIGPESSEPEPPPPAQQAGRLPGWLQAEAPESGSGPHTQEFPELGGTPSAAPAISMSGSKDMDWLKGEEHKSTPDRPPFDAGGEVSNSAASAGVGALPDWLEGEEQKATPNRPPFDAGGEVSNSAASIGGGALPDWLKPMGAGEGDELGEGSAASPFTEDEKRPLEAEPPAAAPQPPAWLAADVSSGLWSDEKKEPPEPEEEKEEDEVPQTAPLAARLAGLTPSPVEEPPAETEPDVPEGDGSEWLKRLPAQPSTPSDMETPLWLKAEARESEEPGEGEKPEWMRPAEDETPAEAPAEAGEIPDWLKAAGRVLPATPSAASAPPEAQAAPPEAIPADMPDWLKPVGAEDQVLPPAPKFVPPPAVEGEKTKGGEAPGWLLELASQTAAEPIPEPEPAAELPAWLDERQPGASDTVSRWLGENTPAEEAEQEQAEESEGGELPSWVSAMAGKGGSSGRTPGGAFDEPKEAEGTALPAPAEPGPGEMPTPDWIKAAMGEVDSEVSRSFPAAHEAPIAETTPPSAPIRAQAKPSAPDVIVPAPPAAPPVTSVEPAAPTPAAPRRPAPPIARPPAEPAGPAMAPSPAAEPAEEPLPAAAPEPGRWVPAEPVEMRAAPPAPAREPAHRPQQPSPPLAPASAVKSKRAAKRKPARLTAPEAEALMREAREKMRGGRVDEAVRAYQRVLESDELAPQVASDLEQAVESKPLLGELWQLLGDACHRTGQLDRAYEAYEKALSLL